ncbi:MAG: sigma-70 family RNA polymerase sigma factor [Bacteroidales bacterium]|nr:sigma-70 family RNA polymerase sigma factor [Bacteroidales bacterium]
MLRVELSDQELVNQYISGSELAFEILLKRHKRKILTYINIQVRNKTLAEDIFQDTFYKVIITLRSGNYNEEGKFIQWVMRIAHNLIVDHFRKEYRMRFIENSDEYDIFSFIKIYDENIEEKLCKEQIHNDVRKLVARLPEEQKEVLIMRHYADMDFKEIATKTGVSINTALGRMRYALINLRKMVEEKKVILTV